MKASITCLTISKNWYDSEPSQGQWIKRDPIAGVLKELDRGFKGWRETDVANKARGVAPGRVATRSGDRSPEAMLIAEGRGTQQDQIVPSTWNR